ncbi:MAG TPA: septum formation initiator family protein [Prolixibacteraceae bacterium]|nr:septum formation initiator family protein [Prolixibacteraceae bacterium]
MKQVFVRFLSKYKVYLIIVAVFLIWMLFFDEYNWIRMGKESRKLRRLKQETDYLEQKIESDRSRLDALKNDTAELEKLAREKYFLKKENEDVFVIIDPQE